MDLRDLKLFLHLAESHHFGRTAKAMHVSPSTLSRQIQRLEGILGQPLFLRDNRTDAADRRRRTAERIRPANAAVSTAEALARPARPFAERRTAAVLFGDRGVQPPAADPRSLPRAAPAGRD